MKKGSYREVISFFIYTSERKAKSGAFMSPLPFPRQEAAVSCRGNESE